MGTKYSNQTVTGFNSSPPADDGSTTAANKVTYATIKTKLGDPLNTWASALNTAILNALDTSCSSITGNYTTVAGDNAKTLQCSGTFTLSLGDASTLAAGWYCNIVNAGSGTVTIGRATAGNTLAGAASNITLAPLQATTVVVNAAANGFNITDCNSLIVDNADPTKQLRFNASGILTGTTRVLTAQDANGSIALTSEFAYLGLPSSSGRLLLPNDYLTGFALTNNGATGFDVAAGQAMDSTNVSNIVGSAIANKTQAAWVAGAAAGGKLHAAAMANNAWYYWFALWKTADGTVDYGFDVATTPTLPSGYSKYRYIGARKTQFASTNWDTFIQHGDEVLWNTPPALDFNGAMTAANRVLTTMNVPAIKVKWFGNAQLNNTPSTGMFFLLTDPATADVASVVSGSPLGSGGSSLGATGGNVQTVAQVTCWTNASSQIGVRGSGTGTLIIQTLGWIDSRGKPV